MLRFSVLSFVAFLVLSAGATRVADAQVMLWGRQVSSIDDTAVPSEPQQAPAAAISGRSEHVGRKRARRYTGTLALSYVPGPLLLAIWGGVEGSCSDRCPWREEHTVLVVMAAGSFFAPSLTHLLQGESRRAREALLGSFGAAAGIGLLGYVIGVATASEPDPEEINDSIYFRELGQGVPGLLIGASIGLAAWGVFDVIRTQVADSASMKVAWLPTPDGGVLTMRGSF